MGSKISIKGLDKAAVLAALYNNSRPLGMGILHFNPAPMTVEEARRHLVAGDDHVKMFPELMNSPKFHTNKTTLDFDYLNGRVMKVSLSGDEFDPWGYDRDNGQGAAERALKGAGLI